VDVLPSARGLRSVRNGEQPRRVPGGAVERHGAEVMWTPIKGTPDYETDKLIAVYKRTDRGHAYFHIFDKSTPKRQRTWRNVVSVGGIPINAILNGRGLSSLLPTNTREDGNG
jgi:hypothetical protein